HLPEAVPERVHPEVVEALGITRSDVPGDTLLEPEVAEEPQASSEALLAVQPLLRRRLVLRQVPALVTGRDVGHGASSSARMRTSTLDHGRKRSTPASSTTAPSSVTNRPVAPAASISARPSSVPATNAAFASTSARAASAATTVTDASPDAAGAPVR